MSDLRTSDAAQGTEETTWEDDWSDGRSGAADEQAPEPGDVPVEVRRDGPLAAVVALLAAGVAVAYLLRAVGSGDALDWVVTAATGALAMLHLTVLLDSRAPLMVVDGQGVRVRRGASWQGVAWPEVVRVVHRPRQSLLRDGVLEVHDVDDRVLSVRLSLSTRLFGADWHELGDALRELSDDAVEVVEPAPAADPEPAAEPAPEAESYDEPVTEEAEAAEAAEAADVPAVEQTVVVPAASVVAAGEPAVPEPVDLEPVDLEDTQVVAPGRETVAGRRSDVVLAPTHAEPTAVLNAQPLAPELADDEPTLVVGEPDGSGAPVVPVVGPQLVAARERLRLSVDQLAERTRIRPHVIEAIEVDDFGPCGGDFYARGHLRTLARVLGVDAAPLLAEYDARYAAAPIDPRRVFEAELAAGRQRPGRHRLNWSVLVAAVMAVVLVWSVARLPMEGPAPVADRPTLNGSPGSSATLSGSTTKVPVEITATTGGAAVIVRDGRQRVVFDDDLAFMQTAELTVVPPVRISSTDGGLDVTVDGEDHGALGATGQEAQRVYVP